MRAEIKLYCSSAERISVEKKLEKAIKAFGPANTTVEIFILSFVETDKQTERPIFKLNTDLIKK